MPQLTLQHMHEDVELMKRDLAVIKHILSQEGHLSDWAKAQLAKARNDPEPSYTDLNDI